jgi:uncharacterized protein DUF3482/50S ribosome-binding GTPase
VNASGTAANDAATLREAAARETATSGHDATIALSLVSHTNAGKTTLARTLLAEDIGEVRDAAHVTLEASEHVLVSAASGARLVLWDTPGFGDSARLARRLALQRHPIGWLLTQVWDRFRERPLWLAQQAVRNVRDHADVVLYLVNAAENPADAGYLPGELQVLGWIGKPVIALLNQTGRPRPAAEEAADVERWRAALASQADVQEVLGLDAFARCWVQEIVLLRAVRAALPPARQPAFDALMRAWTTRRLDQFGAAMQALAQPLAGALHDVVTVPDDAASWRGVRRLLGFDRGAQARAYAAAMKPLARRLDAAIRSSTDAMIALYGLEGGSAQEVTRWLSDNVRAQEGVHEGKAAMWGGIVSGALSGLVADLAAGGATLGAGMLVGGVVGALGGAGIARGYNSVRGTRGTMLRWSDAFLDDLVRGSLLRYLAVAHYGRGRGPWTQVQPPAFWSEAVGAAVGERSARYTALREARATASVDDVRALLQETALAVLRALYPGPVAAIDALAKGVQAPAGR